MTRFENSDKEKKPSVPLQNKIGFAGIGPDDEPMSWTLTLPGENSVGYAEPFRPEKEDLIPQPVSFD
ncbi:hypothetical protein PPEV_gp164 [Pseudomonas phage EL]|uniref:Uncharacterized protein n=1 Tax=Pseudomonas phage EL TaxID=273133 RepID=Q2Z0R7_9CAUD|nr:hypothetical protein PPEV_gp164 [Pseudomonas phage EL]UZV40094.1 hypothetical protein [Pseudomonas phage IR-QUMS-PaBa1-GHS-2021]CAG27258.1 hypothetical protein [Pseudomonas phage EL]